jgi:hypothetical protein
MTSITLPSEVLPGVRRVAHNGRCIVRRLPILASTGPLILGVAVVASLVLIAVLLRNP